MKKIKENENKLFGVEEQIKNIAIDTVKTNIKEKYNLGDEGNNNTKIESLFDEIVESIVTNKISIPRVTVQQTLDISWRFKDFDLNTKNLNYQPTDESIIIKELRNSTVEIIDSNKNINVTDSLQNIILKELLIYLEIDYDLFSELI